MLRLPHLGLLCSFVALLTVALAETAPPIANLRAGAARIDITPASDAALPFSGYGNRVLPFEGVHDNLHVRAIVVDDGSSQAAIVSVELIGLSHALWENLSSRVTEATGIPKENIMLTSVHTHAAPAIGGLPGPGSAAAGQAAEVARKRADYVKKVEDAIIAAVVEAKTNLQPAKMGYGTGRANVSMNRRARTADGGWHLGHNPDGPSDKTVAVVKFETMDGKPFAVFSNYGVHATVMGPSNLQVSADLPGATSRFVEEHYGKRRDRPLDERRRWRPGADL